MSRRPTSSRDAAEAAFRKATTPERAKEAPRVPGARETISLRVDADVLERFQEDGPGWQERMNDALRKAVSL